MTTDSPVLVLFNSDGVEVNVKNATALPTDITGILAAGSDGTNSRFIAVDISGRPIVVGAGTAGSPAGGVVSIQGVASGTPVPISGTVTATNASTGATGASPPAQATYVAGLSTTAAPSYTNNQLNALSLTLAGALRVDGSAVTQPVSGTVTANQGGAWTVAATQSGTWNINNISGTVSLPTGAATEATLATLLTTSAFQARINTLGQKTMANSTPVVIASDQSAVTISGTVSGTGNFTVVQSTASNLRAQTASESATGAAVPPTANLAGGSVTTAAPTYTNGNLGALSLTTSGLLRVDGSGVTQPISAASLPLPTGAATETTLATLLTTTAFQARINTLGQKTMANSTPVVLASDQTVIPVSQSGSWTVTANAGTGNFNTNIAQYGGTNVGAGNAVHVQPGTGATFTVVQATAANLRSQTASESATGAAPPALAGLAGGSVTTAAPTYTTGQMSALSLTTAGGLRVDGSGVTQPVSGTVTANQGTANTLANRWPVIVTDGTNTMPTGDAAARGIFQRVTDGTNTAAVKAASTAAVAADPALVVAVSPNNTSFTRDREFATFTALATGIALGNNKSMFSIQNTTGSAVKCRIHEIYLVNVQTATTTGVVATFELRRATSHAAGTQITAIESMETTDSLNSSITVRTNATITGESATLLWRNLWSSDEWGPGSADTESTDHAWQTMFPIYSRKTHGLKPIILNANETLTVKCATNTTAGTFDLIVVFTQE